MSSLIVDQCRAAQETARSSRIKALCATALIAMLLLGGAWFVGNAPHVPAYGDTTEYLALSKSLVVDQYRTVFYPWILRLCLVLRAGKSEPSVFWLYLVQTLASLISCGIYAAAVLKSFAVPAKQARAGHSIVMLAALLGTTNPLVGHFSLSIMSDSLASSLTVATVGAMTHLAGAGGSQSPYRLRWGWLLMSVACLFLMALSRVDKLYLGCALVIALTLYMYVIHLGISHTRRAMVTTLPLAVALVLAMAVNHWTQMPSSNRPALNASNMAFNRVVWPRLVEIYPYLPEDAKALVSTDQAKWFDEHNNHVYPMLDRMLAGHPENQRIVNEITRTTLLRYPWQVVGKASFDIAKYVLPNLSFPLELAAVLPKSVATDWTYSRMSKPYPVLTFAWMVVSTLGFYLFQLPAAMAYLRELGSQAWRRSPLVWLTLAAVGCNAIMFGLESGMDSHVRYALPAFTMILVLAIVPSLLWLLRPLRR